MLVIKIQTVVYFYFHICTDRVIIFVSVLTKIKSNTINAWLEIFCFNFLDKIICFQHFLSTDRWAVSVVIVRLWRYMFRSNTWKNVNIELLRMFRNIVVYNTEWKFYIELLKCTLWKWNDQRLFHNHNE